MRHYKHNEIENETEDKIGICPRCKSWRLEYGSSNIEGDQLVYEVDCYDCGFCGYECYALVFNAYTER